LLPATGHRVNIAGQARDAAMITLTAVHPVCVAANQPAGGTLERASMFFFVIALFAHEYITLSAITGSCNIAYNTGSFFRVHTR
jgi:hypothetical protein